MLYRIFSHRLLKCLFVVILINFVWLGFPNIAKAELTTITVKIEPTKANEKKWDVLKGAPDLALCLTHPLTGMLCLPNGDSIETILKPECPNSYQCRFSVEIPDQTFKIAVVDVDVAFNDVIGIGHCQQGKTCELGQATVVVGR